jgi:hypothetical protein
MVCFTPPEMPADIENGAPGDKPEAFVLLDP